MKIFGWSMAALGALILSHSAMAQETKLVIATLVEPGTVVNVQVVEPWAKRVNEAGKGVLSIEVREGSALGDFSNIYDRVLADVFQIGFGVQNAVGGKFPLTTVLALPLLFDNEEDASVAFWRVYKSGAMNSEYDRIVPLMLVAFPSAALHFAKPLTSLDTFAGSKIIVPGKVHGGRDYQFGRDTDLAQAHRGHEAIQRHTVNGTMIAWLGFNPWKLAEVASYHIDSKLGGGAGMIFMSREKYAALPEAARKILDSNSGEAESRTFGKAMHVENDNQRASVTALPKHTVVTPTPEQAANWQQKVAPRPHKMDPGQQRRRCRVVAIPCCHGRRESREIAKACRSSDATETE